MNSMWVYLPVVALMFGGCSLAPVLRESSIDYNQVVDDVTSNVLVTNILRGRDSAKLNLSSLSSVHGSFSATLGDQETIPFGPTFKATTRRSAQIGPLTINSNPNIDIAPSDTKKFYEGLLSSVSEGVLEHYIQRGVPPRIILDLFLSEIDQRTGGEITISRSGAPTARERQAFYDLLHRWTVRARSARPIFHKLKVVVESKKDAYGPPLQANFQSVLGAKTAGLEIQDLGRGKIQLSQTSNRVTLCVPNAADDGYDAVGLVSNSVTKINPTDKFIKTNAACTAGGESRPQTTQYQAHLRSVEGLFYYLGFVSSDISVDPELPFYIYDHPVSDARFSVKYEDKEYYVRNVDEDPMHPDVTVAIIAILNSVVNLNRDADEIPTTKNVQVVNGR